MNIAETCTAACTDLLMKFDGKLKTRLFGPSLLFYRSP